jgi:hypothetical protein
MSTSPLEQRVEALETKYAELLEMVRKKPSRDAWRKVVGMFADDPDIEELHEETQRIREADRLAARSAALDGDLDQGDV